MKKTLSKLSAYFYMPIIFLLLGIAILAVIFYPFLGVAKTAANLLFSNTDTNTESMGNATFIESETQTVPTEQSNTVNMKDIEWPTDGDQYGKLICKKIGLDTIVYWGDSYEILREGAGTQRGSGIPGNNRTMLIGGHNTTDFTVLQNIAKGDVITFKTSYGVYEYEITDTKVLNFSDPTAFDMAKKEEQLVLYTCYPFTELSATTDRFFVYGKRIAGPELVRSEDIKGE